MKAILNKLYQAIWAIDERLAKLEEREAAPEDEVNALEEAREHLDFAIEAIIDVVGRDV